MIPGMITAKVAAVVGAAALVVGLGLGGWLAHVIYAPQLETAATKLDAANLKIETLGEDIRRQNQAIDKIRKDAEALAAKAAKALQAAQAARDQAEADAQNLLAAQPAPGEDHCTAASALIRKELGR